MKYSKETYQKALKALDALRKTLPEEQRPTLDFVAEAIREKAERDLMPAADVAPVVRCKDCKHSTLPSKLTQLYGETGTLTCRFGPCNRRNVNENDFCSYAERKDGGTE